MGTDRVQVSDIQIEWNLKRGTCTFEKLPVALMWVDTTLAGMMSGVQAMVGTERFLLALQSAGRKSVEEDWQVIVKFPDFPQGFKAIANIAAVAGWGAWVLVSLDENQPEACFRVTDSWEGLYQKALGVCWGSGMLAGKMAGYCSKLFGTNCWAEQTGFIATGDAWDEFVVKPSSRTLEKEIDDLFASDSATRADMAVALRRLEKEIADRSRVEVALRRSEEKYRQLVQQIPTVVYKGYTDWSLECFDQKIEELTGYTMEDFNTRRVSWLDLIFPEDIEQAKKLFLEALKGKGDYVTEHRIKTKSQEVRWVQARNRIILNPNGKVDHISGIFFDITERKRLEDQLASSQRMEAVGLLAGGLAHDFNNLLTAILGYGEIMKMDLRPEDPLSSYLDEIIKATNRGASLTNQLLAFSRKQLLQPRVIDLNFTVADMKQMLQRLIGEDIELVTDLEEKLEFIKADPSQIEQIIMNLALNARDAMPQGGTLILETANVYLDDSYVQSHVGTSPGFYVMLAVSDDGLGMDAKTLSHIFEPFFTTKEVGKGTGLGLSTVYGIVKQSGGHIWVYSEPGQGTTFKIYFPPSAEGLEPEKPLLEPTVTLTGRETILVVEDDAALRELVSRALKKYGYKVLNAGTGGEALIICEKAMGPIHLVLTDVVMPQMSGRELAERLALSHPDLKVLYMSGYTQNAIVRHGVLDLGINFIQKPFKIIKLLQKVRGVIDKQ